MDDRIFMDEGILSAIGHTPLVRLSKVLKEAPFRLYAKLEGLNPGGSMKDRAAISIIRDALLTGRIKKDTVIIESSSGNMGIGLAQACSYFGLRFICVVDPKTTAQNIALLRTYGAEIDLVREPDAVTKEYLKARLDRVRYLSSVIENCYWPDQYSNLNNPRGHYQTMDEIARSLGEVDYLFCTTSTCGTMRGCAEYARQHGLKTKVIAVDAIGSVIFCGERANRLIPGHGAAIRPALYQPNLALECIHVSDVDCIVGCRRLALEEAILAGGSSGAVFMAVEKYKDRIPPGSTCVVIFADRGERYLDTIYSDEWVAKYFGEVSHLWQSGHHAAAARELVAERS
ncbi:MAG: 2,3-diaminopropionate biosynthesis protein SbnA [Pyrinomonadaceae bacterium]